MSRLAPRALAATLAFAAACTPRGGAPASLAGASYDVIIERGRVVDGTGAPWFEGDVGIKGDRIVAVVPAGRLASAQAAERVDARGMVIAPGFIDVQGQSIFQFLVGDGRVISKVTQGVTTEILGEGDTPAPQNDRTLQGIDARDTLSRRLAQRYMGPHGFDRWLRDMEAHGMSVNAGSFVGAGTLREFGMAQAQGAAPADRVAAMQAAAAEAMQDGAFGVGSALIYPPGNYATTGELVAIAKAIAPYGGLYISHMRSEGDNLLGAIDELLTIARDGGVRAEIWHFKAGGVRNWPLGPRAIAKVDSARAAGLDVQATMYPYTAGGTGLTACLPPWVSANGKLFSNLADPATRAKIRAEMEHPTSAWEPLCELATPDGVLIAELKSPAFARYGGQRLGAIAKAIGKDLIETIFDLIVAEQTRVETLFFMMSEENVKLNLRQPWMIIGTDADGPDPATATGLVHPRTYGTYPRILGKYVRDEKVLPLEDAIRKFSGAVATRLAIPDRGLLKPGMMADVVVFDPATIAEHATFEKPHQLSTGVRDVWVNGARVLKDGAHTGAKPGRALRGPGYQAP